ncbi:thiamine pyrophosphate-binding protein [Paracoccus aestuariivivens]|uniref:Thiamine pyrophosphate-binding protein n=1 Tax=Paracoccus aestuariivivens TaxID=1820333 RepID=A0A6L6JHU4_9RHOB|nr:thiamine pyrophosphate-binding protein [Paracoccus aestuariivivens]MTH80289.1 thiamine pyrophosphate-binding protein [Paracoccus aestuariivivens]
MRHGGQILIDQLKIHGTKRVFSVPGESFLAALDALHDSAIENIVCRHEGGAAMMAEAHGKLTGQPGICFVTRGPGATNASAGVHVAKQDSTPMILFVGQIDRSHRDREAFQEVDYRAMFGTVAKWVTEIDQIERLPEYISRAFHVAMSGRPGPVVLALPEDMLSARADVADLPAAAPIPSAISPAQVEALTAALAHAERPLLMVGGTLWDEKASDDLSRFAQAWNLPVAVPFRRQCHLDNRNPHYVGDLGIGMNPKLGARLQQADCLIMIGGRLGDSMTRGYELMDPAAPTKTIVHVYPDASELGRVYRPDLGIVAPTCDMIAALAHTKPANNGWDGWTAAARAEYEAWVQPKETPGDVKMEQVIHWLSQNLPDNAILTNGAGNYAAFLHRYFVYKKPFTQLAPTSGSMGYGFPAAVSAAIEHRDRPVVCLAGDGCFQMTLNEMSTARQYNAAPIVVVANNGQYGTIRMHQERHYPERPSGTALANPDFAALARAYGGHGETVHSTAEFGAAFARARVSGTLAVIELRLDPEALSSGATLSQVRAQGLAARN